MLPTSPDVKPTEDKSKKRINKVSQKENPKVAGKQEGSVPGPIQAIDLVAEESGEGFVKLRNKEKEEEEAAEQAAKEEEEKKEKCQNLVDQQNSYRVLCTVYCVGTVEEQRV